MTALVFTAVAVLAVAGVLVLALHHQPRQENTMPEQPHTLTQPDLTADQGSCEITGSHDHIWRKRRPGFADDLVMGVPVSVSGVVILSEGAVEQLLVEAGFTRSES